MDNQIRLAKSVLSEAEVAAVKDVILRCGYLGMGDIVGEFEKELAMFIGCESVVCVNTGTSALHLALQAAGISAGDEVLVPALTYIASYQAISATGGTPVSCDIDPNSGLIDLADAATRITSRTKALLYVHYASNFHQLEELYAFGNKYNLRIIEDAAHSFGCEYKGKKIGQLGDIVCFSFDGIKNITCGEGGAIVSSDKAVISLARDLRLLGVEKDSDARYRGARTWEFDVKHQGWRYHMSNIMAAIGRVQLKRFQSEFKRKRIDLAHCYRKKLSTMRDIELFEQNTSTGTTIVPHLMPIKVKNNKKELVRSFLLQNNVQTGIHYYPNHFLSKYKKENEMLPGVESVYRELLTLPLHPELTADDIDYIVSLIRKKVESE